MKVTTFFILVLLNLSTACSKQSNPSSCPKSTYNRVGCDRIDYSTFHTEAIDGIVINDQGISEKEKIRHLNEIASLPNSFLEPFRKNKLTINLTRGSIVEFQRFAYLAPIRPTNWPEGTTYKDVAGTGDWSGVYLGSSAKPSGVDSLAIHEIAHALDLSTGISSQEKFRKIFEKDHERMLGNALGGYRMSNQYEFFAVGMDEYFCRAITNYGLKRAYPELHQYIQELYPDSKTRFPEIKSCD